jgi:translation elongation factor EF-G
MAILDIGILARVDAAKTHLTRRILYATGGTSSGFDPRASSRPRRGEE